MPIKCPESGSSEHPFVSGLLCLLLPLPPLSSAGPGLLPSYLLARGAYFLGLFCDDFACGLIPQTFIYVWEDSEAGIEGSFTFSSARRLGGTPNLGQSQVNLSA